MIEMSVQQGVVLDTLNQDVRNPELCRCFRHEGEDCPRCDGSGYRLRKHCTGCDEPAGAPLRAARYCNPHTQPGAGKRPAISPSTAGSAALASPLLQRWRSSREWAADMPVRISCEECDGTGWVRYRSETLDGDLEEAYSLCPRGCIPRYCMARFNERPCRRPGTARYGLGYFRKQLVEVIC